MTITNKSFIKSIHYFLLLCFSSVASANECRMTIHAKNDTGSPVAAGLFNQKDEKVAVMSIDGKAEVVFKDLSVFKWFETDGLIS